MVNLKYYRELRGLTMEELGKKVGCTLSAISNYERGKREPNYEMLLKLSEALDTDVYHLLGKAEPDITESYVTFPIIAETAAGYGRFAEHEDYSSGEIDIPLSWLHGRPRSDYFVIKVKGDSMFPAYQDGDLVLVLKQSTFNYSGQIGVVMYDDNSGTLKKVEYIMGEDWMRLVPINPAYPPVMVTGERLEHCRVLGIAKMVIREVN